MLIVSPWPGNMMSNMLLQNIVYFWFLINWEDPRPTRYWPDHFLLNYHFFTRCTCNLKHKASCNLSFCVLTYQLCLSKVFVVFQWWRATDLKAWKFFGVMPQTPLWLNTLHAIVHSSINTITCFTVITFMIWRNSEQTEADWKMDEKFTEKWIWYKTCVWCILRYYCRTGFNCIV